MRPPTSLRKIFNNWILLLLLISVLALWQLVLSQQQNQTCVWFLNVGEGDAIYIRSQDRKDILIDGGSSQQVLAELQKVMPFMDKTIDLLVATHPDKDHIGGLDDVLHYFQVKEIWWNGEQKKSRAFRQFWEAAMEEEKNGASVEVPEVGRLKIFPPDEKFQLVYFNHSVWGNARSLVTMFNHRQLRFLFTGDLPATEEKKLPTDKVTVLKVGHHGSKSSTSLDFLTRIKPEYAVISVGKNSYGHPHQMVLDRLKQQGIKTLRTDEKGDVGFCISQDKDLDLLTR